MSLRSLKTAVPLSGGSQQMLRSDRNMLALSDENSMLKQIEATHASDGREFDLRPLLHIVEDILNRAGIVHVETTASQTHAEMEDKNREANFISMLEALSFVIDRIACEISYKALGGADPHATTMSLLSMLSSYNWDAKLMLIMSAFALNYGEFWLLVQIYSSNPLAKSMAILKQLPSIMEHTAPLKPRFDALNSLIRVMMDVTKCVVELRELPSAYISADAQALTTAIAHIPTAVYWTIRSIVACATQITSLTTLGHEFATTEAWELSTLAHKLQNIDDHLRKQLSTCHQHIDEKRSVESYQILLNLFDSIHIDNMKILKALIYSKDDIQPLVDGSTKRRVNIDVLRRKNVLLFISGLDISRDELSILEQIYNESRIHATRMESHQYEVVWIPVVDRTIQWNDAKQKQFESLQSTMPWYTVHSPTMIDKVVIRFIKEVWHLRNKPILVVLDPQGKVVCPNALHMMWIWGSNAFPFTTLREESLWRDETWRLELLVDGIDPSILDWIKEGKYIFLYGGDDVEWVRKFTTTAKALAQAARIPLELVYVGKSSKREKIQRIIATITVEKLGHYWDPTMIWFFWTRLESMLFSKIQLGKIDEHDPMMQEIKKLLSYDKEGGWAVLSRGGSVVVNGHSSTMLPTLTEYDLWKEHIGAKGFDMSFKDHHDKLHSLAHPCSRFEFHSMTGRIPERLKCPECLRGMEKYITFRCCHEEDVGEIEY
ncbi:protein SIEVE ELEMENT OCCLUSION B-like [Mercurialis annua]|uniref:protein SIEVE ELEMENT OCCLUSION B-like n=1 Tax=Mercurialis annua TaxID=3986 RepID=UPI00215EDDAD|nr:protein SIEVE ELEMENT OCCLUSION B-like [Mercurialis annua]